jgi:hypothetical protein
VRVLPSFEIVMVPHHITFPFLSPWPDDAFAMISMRARSSMKKGLFIRAKVPQAYPPTPDCDATR